MPSLSLRSNEDEQRDRQASALGCLFLGVLKGVTSGGRGGGMHDTQPVQLVLTL